MSAGGEQGEPDTKRARTAADDEGAAAAAAAAAAAPMSEEELLIREEHGIWKKNAPFLYDFVIVCLAHLLPVTPQLQHFTLTHLSQPWDDDRATRSTGRA